MNEGLNQEELKIYLKDIKKIPVMTKERENQIKQMMLDPNLTPLQTSKLRDEMVTSNLRFVLTIAKKYQNQGLDLIDLISEGNIGLIRAFETFDWSIESGFNTYAVHWIKSKILDALHKDARTIRIPVNVIQNTLKEIKTNTNPDTHFRSLNLTKSYDELINEEGDTFLDLLFDSEQKGIDEIDNSDDKLKKLLFKILEVLDERERDIILSYHGFKGGHITLQDIGDDYNLTKERVRQIKEKALRKLRMESKILFEYFENN